MGSVLLTGGSGGIGTALVDGLVAAGHDVTAVVRGAASAARVEECGATAVTADLAAVELLAEAVPLPDRLDALVHCAAVAPVAPVAGTAPETWREVLTVNVAAAAELTRLTLPALRRARGHVVFVNASPGMHAVPRWSAFVGSKHALREVADSLRAEEARYGVRVTTVYPAATATSRLGAIRAAFGRGFDPQACIQPTTLAAMVGWILSAPADSYVSELSVLPTPRP